MPSGESRLTDLALLLHCIRDKVASPGWVSNPLAYMRDASVVVLSPWERFGNVVVEVMAEAIPGTLDDPLEPGILVARAQEFSVETHEQRYCALLEL